MAWRSSRWNYERENNEKEKEEKKEVNKKGAKKKNRNERRRIGGGKEGRQQEERRKGGKKTMKKKRQKGEKERNLQLRSSGGLKDIRDLQMAGIQDHLMDVLLQDYPREREKKNKEEKWKSYKNVNDPKPSFFFLG